MADEWDAKAREITNPHVICGDGIFSPNTTINAVKAFEAQIAAALREAYLRGRNEADIAAERREGGRVMSAKFEKQTYGAVVATILETDNSIVEVQERNDGFYGLIVHRRREDRDQWDDLTAYLKPEHFDALGSVARRMRGEQERCKGPYTPSEADTAAERRGIERAAKVALDVWDRGNAGAHGGEQANRTAAAIRALAPPMADAGPTEPPGASTGRG